MKKMKFKYMKVSIIIIWIIILSVLLIGLRYKYFQNYNELNLELHKYGYNQYDNKPKTPKNFYSMYKLIKESEIPHQSIIYIPIKDLWMPINYELLGNNLKKNYLNPNLEIIDKWYIMFNDYDNLKKVSGNICYSEYHEHSEKKNVTYRWRCDEGEYHYFFSFDGMGDNPYKLYVGLEFAKENNNRKKINNTCKKEDMGNFYSVDYSKNKEYTYVCSYYFTNEFAEKKIEEFTDKIYAKYLKEIGIK